MTVGAAAGCLLMTAGSASALSFTTDYTGIAPAGNLFLNSITTQGGTTISDFSAVTGADLTNTPFNGGNTGAASSDRGDDANGIAVEDPNNANIVSSLGRDADGKLNLNNIVDTEDNGFFTLELEFEEAFNTLLLWERGMNSRIQVIAGSINEVLDSSTFDYSGFNIDTTEITTNNDQGQRVGSYGIKLGESVTKVTLISESSFRGPDFKVVGATVPEPATVLGLTAVAGAFVASRRRKGERTA